MLGRGFRAGAFLDPRFFVVPLFEARDLFAAVPFFFVRFAPVDRFFAVVARAGRLVVFFAAFARAGRFVVVFFARSVRPALFALAELLFFAVVLRGVAFARVVRFFAVVLRGPVFLAVVRRGVVPVDRFVPPALALVARFFAGALREPAFLARVVRVVDRRR